MNIFYTLKVLQALINNDLCTLKANEIKVGGWIHNPGVEGSSPSFPPIKTPLSKDLGVFL